MLRQQPSDHSQRYIELIWELDKHFPGLVDSYFGPPEIRNQVKRRPVKTLIELRKMIDKSLEALPRKTPLADPEADYLQSELVALATFIDRQILQRKRGRVGEDFSSFASRILEVEVRPVEEKTIKLQQERIREFFGRTYPHLNFASDFRLAIDRDLIGGPRLDRFRELYREFKQGLSHFRQITAQFLDLPTNAYERVRLFTGNTVAYVKYHGNMRSTVLVNPGVARTRRSTRQLAMHEFHPGHLSHYEMREAYSAGNPLANTFVFMTPDATVVEGIGEFAPELLAPHLSKSEQGETFDPLESAVGKLRSNVANNATLMFFSGSDRAQTAKYLEAFGWYNTREVEQFFKFRKVPFFDVYALSYRYGYQLVKSAYLKAKKLGTERELLDFIYKNQVSPATIRAWLKQNKG